MKRFLVVCADLACTEQATSDGYNNIEFPEDSSNQNTAYGRFTWDETEDFVGGCWIRREYVHGGRRRGAF